MVKRKLAYNSHRRADEVAPQGPPEKAEMLTEETGALLRQLEATYREKGKMQEFALERDVYTSLLPRLLEDLAPSYEVVRLCNIGSTASVWVVRDKKLEQDRALKLPRPRHRKLADIIPIVRNEVKQMASLNHQNIVKIYTAGEIPLQVETERHVFPYFVMEFLDVTDLDKFILDNHRLISAERIITYFRDLLAGLHFLHSEGIVHCDIKPGNLLISKDPQRPALVSDLGYAKPLPTSISERDETTEVRYTPPYAHPELRKHVRSMTDSAANRALIKRSDLSPKFDLFAFGRTMQEILHKLRETEESDPEKDYGRKSVLTPYQKMFLGLVSKRLLGGIIENREKEVVRSDLIPGLSDRDMNEICYRSADDALEDLEKLLGIYDLEGEVPELNPDLTSYIQIPGCKAPLTPRVQDLISHPGFVRLKNVTQLGFVSLVYEGANHKRSEHVLGTLAQCCRYVRALWYDDANCLFRCIMSREDIDCVLLASLLHDISQYPMAHDLTEIASDFHHERFMQHVLERVDPSSGMSLSEVARIAWGIEVQDVLRILSAGQESALRHRILKSLISGPLDCDKLDYLLRDSIHLGVKYGNAIDQERLLRNLTISFYSDYMQDGAEEYIAEIGVTEKALVVADSVWKSRKDMFRQVYWQHTVRALKAMLAYVVRNILIRLKSEGKEGEFWGDFQDYLRDPTEALLQVKRKQNTLTGRNAQDSSAIFEPRGASGGIEDSFDEPDWLSWSHLTIPDDSMLAFLWNYASGAEKAIIALIRSRNLFCRLAVLSGTTEEKKAQYGIIYDEFRTHRLRGDLEKIEQTRKEWESRILDAACKALDEKPSLVPQEMTRESVRGQLEKVKPLILVDVPIKATTRSHRNELLRFLPEDVFGVHHRDLTPYPRFNTSEISLEQASFDKEVGKIRVLVHPEWTEFFVRCLDHKTVFNVLTGAN